MGKFKVGDKVKALTPGYVEKGSILDVVENLNGSAWINHKEVQANYLNMSHVVNNFELASTSTGLKTTDWPPINITPQDIAGYPKTALEKQVSGNHYKDCKIQPVEYIQANGLSYLEGNVIKYTTRHSKKNGKADIEKAIHYLELILEMEYKDK